MLTWVASYPRAGSHLIRMILKQCFGLDSYDQYNLYRAPSSPAGLQLRSIIGFVVTGSTISLDEFLNDARQRDDVRLVRTHEFVPDDDGAIYVVRDGRAMLASYQYFLSTFLNLDVSLDDLIEGKHWPGHWSAHVRRWLDRDPKKTLILRYEDLRNPSPLIIARLSDFLGKSVVARFTVDFSQLQAIQIEHYRIGHNGPGIAQIEAKHHDLFWREHSEIMHVLGYANAGTCN